MNRVSCLVLQTLIQLELLRGAATDVHCYVADIYFSQINTVFGKY